MALVTANLTYEWVAKLATGSGPGVNSPTPTTTWKANVGSNDITLQNASGNFAWNDSGSGWDGDGTAGDPYCLCADGTGDYGTFAAALVASDADFTIELWNYMGTGAPAANSSYFYNTGGGAFSGLRAYVSSATADLTWLVGNGSSYATIYDSVNAEYGSSWQHNVLTYNASTNYATLYRDGSSPVSAVSTAFTPYTSAGRLFDNTASMNAMKIATLRVYSACLSSDDVAANYAAGVRAASTDSSATFMPHIMCHHFIPQQLGGH